MPQPIRKKILTDSKTMMSSASPPPYLQEHLQWHLKQIRKIYWRKSVILLPKR